MLNSQSILVVEDNHYLALDLSLAIEDLDGTVVGPTRVIAEAEALAERQPLAGAILDCHLDDGCVGRLADLLARRKIPFVLHAAANLPVAIGDRHSAVPVLIKPLQARTVLSRLMIEILRRQRFTENKG